MLVTSSQHLVGKLNLKTHENMSCYEVIIFLSNCTNIQTVVRARPTRFPLFKFIVHARKGLGPRLGGLHFSVNWQDRNRLVLTCKHLKATYHTSDNEPAQVRLHSCVIQVAIRTLTLAIIFFLHLPVYISNVRFIISD